MKLFLLLILLFGCRATNIKRDSSIKTEIGKDGRVKKRSHRENRYQSEYFNSLQHN